MSSPPRVTEGRRRRSNWSIVQSSRWLVRNASYDSAPYRFLFELRQPGRPPTFAACPLAHAAVLVETARNKAARHLGIELPERRVQVDRLLVGRGAGDADKGLRVRIVPIPSIGHKHGDMNIRRLMVLVPQACPLSPADVTWAFSKVVWRDNDGVVVRELHQVDDDRMARRYEGRARRWKSVTALALTRAQRRRIDPYNVSQQVKDEPERVAEEKRAAWAVVQSVRHAEVPAKVTRVAAQREPLDHMGAWAEEFARCTRFNKHAMWHLSVTFSDEVPGPLVLGDGRFLGLGLMRPADTVPSVIAFTIVDGLEPDADPRLVAHAARRAMMARVQASIPKQPLPPYVTGHLKDGSPISDGGHRHLAVVVDLPRRRLLFVAPNHLDRGGLQWHTIARDHRLVARSLQGMDVLRAGKAGRLDLVSAGVDQDEDMLFAPARVWKSVTPYHVMRHRRASSASEAIRIDVLYELERIGWPRPEAIDVVDSWAEPKAGLCGHLRVKFAVDQGGPLLIGRTKHKGGGLLAGWQSLS